MENELVYIYCIADQPLKRDLLSENENLRCLALQGFYVIAKLVSPDEFSEENLRKNFSDLGWIDRNARDHIRVITGVMDKSSVIPFKFGTIFNTIGNLEKFIMDYSASLAENFNNIKGKEEWSVKIYCNREVLTQQIDELSEEVGALQREILQSKPGKAFILKRKKAELIEREIDQVIRTCGQSCYNELASVSELVQINNLLPKEITERTDEMILNCSCFVKVEKIGELLSDIGSLREKYQNAGLEIEATGPWPPFSFISIKEK